MNSVFHTELEPRWNSFPLVFQMANIGAEIGRTINWTKKGNKEMAKNAFYRGLELIDFTIEDPKNINSLGEILRMREMLVDYFAGENIYQSSDESWNKYFYYFNYAARNISA
ncbi:MAG TPA: hypothetical protein PKA38_03470 [Candidatus Levybacteria bacterium]|nr:hypothetical protein [Candidatus Levybacteria bacterium]